MIRTPRGCSQKGPGPPALLGSCEARTTAIVVALSRISCELSGITKSKRAQRGTIPRRDKGRLAPNVRIGDAEKAPLAPNVRNSAPRLRPQQRFARGVAPDLLARESVGAALPTGDGAGDMRGDEDVGLLPQWMICGEWLRVGHVERNSDPAQPQRVDQRIRVDRPASPCVDENRARLHPRKEIGIDELPRSEEHTSELHSHLNLVSPLLL